MKIKICGLFQNVDIDYVNEALPDYIGFVFAKSKRQVSYDQAKIMSSKLDKRIKAVGVFVDASINEIVKLVNNQIIDLVQLHGDEGIDYIEQLKAKINVPIIKAIKMTPETDFGKNIFPVDYYLLDSAISGSGKTFDWSLIKKLDKPFFLAGGIDSGNLDDAIKINAYAIDVSSGVETNGIKDSNKINEIVRRIKNDSR